jgi:hypothetical protein
LSDSDITCVAVTTDEDWANAPDVPVKVTATRADGTVVVAVTIRIWVTPKKKTAAKKTAAKKK